MTATQTGRDCDILAVCRRIHHEHLRARHALALAQCNPRVACGSGHLDEDVAIATGRGVGGNVQAVANVGAGACF